MKYLILIEKDKLSDLDLAFVEYLLKLRMYDLRPFLDSIDEEYIKNKLIKNLGEIDSSDFLDIINQIFYKKSLVYTLNSVDCYSDSLESLLILVNSHPAMTIYSFN